MGAAAGLVIVLIVVAGALRPSAPAVERATLLFDTVKVGDVVRTVRAPGTLVSDHVRLIVATTGGRVEQLPVRPGETVERGRMIVQLSNGDNELAALQVNQQLMLAASAATQLRSTLEQQRLSQQAALAQLRSEYLEAQRNEEVLKGLDQRHLTSRNELMAAHEKREALETRFRVEQERLRGMQASERDQLRLADEQTNGLRRILAEQRARVAALRVTAEASGQLQSLGHPTLELGEWVNSGTELARIVTPGDLKAILRVPETQVRDIAPGQAATVDTRNGLVKGHVTRVEPVSQAGQVGVEIAFDEPLPRSARADMGIEGTIVIETMRNVRYITRPSYVATGRTIQMYRVTPNAGVAERTTVSLGRASSNAVEVLQGLARGDSVILSEVPDVTGARLKLR